MSVRRDHKAADWRRSLTFAPVIISDPAEGCPIVVAAARVRTPEDAGDTPLYAAGSGATAEEAAQKCLFEAEELHFAHYFPSEQQVQARAEQLPGVVVEPPDLLTFSARQFRSRSRWNESHAGRNTVPLRWRRNRVTDWIKSDGGLGSATSWLPADLCVLGRPARPDLPGADTSGLATADTLETAAVHGFLELVERDAVSIWWYNGLVPPRLDLPSLGDELSTAYASWLQAQGRRLVLLRLSLDMPIAVVGALAHDENGGRIAFGFGAGSSFQHAARHAVGELAQCEANMKLMRGQAEARGLDHFSPEARVLLQWHCDTNLHDHGYLGGGEITHAPDREQQLDLEQCIDLCRFRDLQLLTVDLTNSGGPPLARVFVPGLRSVRPRFGPGRLYRVPLAMDLVCEFAGALNPIPFPL